MDNRTIPNLADLAGCAWPAHSESPGARFLVGIADAVSEALANDPRADWADYSPGRADDNVAEAAAEVADGQVPIYYSELWAVFAELRAWGEESDGVADIGGFSPEDDLPKRAGMCLYIIGERLASALLREALEAWRERDDDDDI